MILLTIVDWLGTFFVLFGTIIISLKKSMNPKIKLVAIISFLITAVCFFIIGIIINLPGMIINQFVLFWIDVYGFYNCVKMIRSEKNIKVIIKK